MGVIIKNEIVYAGGGDVVRTSDVLYDGTSAQTSGDSINLTKELSSNEYDFIQVFVAGGIALAQHPIGEAIIPYDKFFNGQPLTVMTARNTTDSNCVFTVSKGANVGGVTQLNVNYTRGSAWSSTNVGVVRVLGIKYAMSGGGGGGTTYTAGTGINTTKFANGEIAVDTMTIADRTYVDDKTEQATESTLGTIKLNSAESVTVDSNGKLKVGGRLGQMPTTTGIYAPNTIQPAAVGDGSLLITEASGTTVGTKTLAVTTGTVINIKAPTNPGQTEYHVQNTYENRIKCASLAFSGAVATLNETTARAGNFVNILSVKIKGSNYTPDSSADITTPDGDIIITTDAPIDPLNINYTQIRVYPPNSYFSSVQAGQGIGGNSGGASVIVGQAVGSNSGNACNIVGGSIYNQGNGNALFGRQHISRKNRWLMAGTGHDNTNGKSEGGVALGEWSIISSDTAFVVGNGSSNTSRSNLFEIKTNGDIYINGVKKTL